MPTVTADSVVPCLKFTRRTVLNAMVERLGGTMPFPLPGDTAVQAQWVDTSIPMPVDTDEYTASLVLAFHARWSGLHCWKDVPYSRRPWSTRRWPWLCRSKINKTRHYAWKIGFARQVVQSINLAPSNNPGRRLYSLARQLTPRGLTQCRYGVSDVMVEVMGTIDKL